MVTFAIGGSTDVDIIEVNVSVLDENEAPFIDVTMDSVTVWENASIDFVIFTFNVTDPDARIANGSAAYKNITNVSLVLEVSSHSCFSEGDCGCLFCLYHSLFV